MLTASLFYFSLLFFPALTLEPFAWISPVEAREVSSVTLAFPELQLIEIKNLPVKKIETTLPVIQAKSALVQDLESGEILYEKNSATVLPIASLTKIMTAILVLEENDPEEITTVTDSSPQTEGSKIWLRTGEKVKVIDLLHGMLINSGNDAAVSLAIYNAGSVEKFVAKMNQKAKILGMTNSHFTNPAGLDDPNHYSTARDLAKLARYSLHNQLLQEIVKKKTYRFRSLSGFTHQLKNTNKLLESFLNIEGLKTGLTKNAGECLITVAISPQGKKILIIVLDSPARFQESKVLTWWVFQNYLWPV
ncbi:D-alanyl-D-alanine carboxypeptidase [Candidatus Peregrinibacteria bacterium CG08_land_8_20_14_0_20_41_10]|nr:MAG: D-alanyl-D-alanine carboxypeptidase [Candidatus Peregrinibacteria bacterium CG08_land_8_20_14_0_20_41_10]